MANYLVIRDGKIKLTISATIDNKGRVFAGNTPVLDSAKVTDPALATSLVKAGKIEEIPEDWFARVGLRDGLEVISADEYRARKESELTPSQRARREINTLYARAEAALNSDSENNVVDYHLLKSQADKLLADWMATYPEDAKAEKREELKEQAEELRRKAKGALLYHLRCSRDADGWLTRHDEYMAKANELEQQADNI